MPIPRLEDLTDCTLDDALRLAEAALRGDDACARRDAEVLLTGTLSCGRSHLYAHAEQRLNAAQAAHFQALIARRAAGAPVAYLLGRREFWSLSLAVSADTLIPRPETELLVERALLQIPATAALRIADLGTGSGAIALAIATERPLCQVIATDISSAALDVARRNAAQLRISNIEFRHGDWCAALADMQCALIIANPPYIPAADPHLDAGDVRFEPRSALTPGPEGLEAIRIITAQARAHLDADGWLLLEHGYDQSAAVTGLMHECGYREIDAYADLSGHKRVAQGRR